MLLQSHMMDLQVWSCSRRNYVCYVTSKSVREFWIHRGSKVTIFQYFGFYISRDRMAMMMIMMIMKQITSYYYGWLGSRVVSVLDSGAEGPGFKSQPRCRVTVLVKLFTPIVPLFTKQQNW